MKDHAKLRAPVADVIVGNDLVTEKARNAAKRVANDRRADVADMHRLGDIRCGEIHDHRAARTHVRSTQVIITQQGLGSCGEGFGQNAKIDESRPGDVGGGKIRKIKVADDFLSQGTRVFSALLGEHHRGVALIVAKAQIRCGRHAANNRLAKCRVQCRGKPRLKLLKNRHVISWDGKSALGFGRRHTGRL